MDEIAYAGFQEWARQWVMLSRRERYNPARGGDHQLWMSIGGSAGHSGLYGVNVSEGTRHTPGGRFWEVEVVNEHEALRQREASKMERKKSDKDARLSVKQDAAVSYLESCEHGDTASGIRKDCGFSSTIADGPFFQELVESGRIVECKVLKGNGQEYDGYRATQTQPDNPSESDCPSATVIQSDRHSPL